MKYDIIIVGAGASGLVTAYQTICKNPQLNILVLEKESIVGRKLNASGNGKCNLTNSDFRVECYHSNSMNVIGDWVLKHCYKEVVSFFEDLGILLYDKNGYYYPVSNQAKQVSSLLYEKGKSLGVNYRLDSKVTSVKKLGNDENVTYEVLVKEVDGQELRLEATYVVLATGGFSASKLGGCKDGYRLGKKLGLNYNSIYPVLSPIYVEDKFLSVAKGVRIDGNVTLKINNSEIIKESGQIQFNDNNLSGIVMMNLSCYWNRYQGNNVSAVLSIDVLPQYTWDEVKAFINSQSKIFPNETVDALLKGVLPGAFVTYLTKRLNIDRNLLIGQLTEKHLNRMTSNLKKLEFSPTYVEEFEKAQVTGGGISLDEVDIETFESNTCKNLYLTGELLDVNGKCGGYNLTFAVISGIQVAENIVCKTNM